jgi:flavin-dependent dehydrogenase
MKKYDLVIIGAGTSGAYLAREIAKRGHSVLVIEKNSRDKTGTKYDIFHIEEREFARLGIPRPVEGDAAWAFEFEKNYNSDPLCLYPKLQINPTVGLHLHEYTLLMNDLALEAGAEIEYEAEFVSLTFDKAGRVSGVKYIQGGEEKTAGARITADCSGINAAARTSLPDGYGIENFTPGDDDMFYVILRYVRLKNKEDYLDSSTFWAPYKSWIAPCADPGGAIIGIGACHSFEYAERMYAEMEKTVPLPEYELVKVEMGRTPFTRSPYSLVADNFIVSGDAGCLTKSVNGEGVTSSIYMLKIAAAAIDRAFKTGDTSKYALWRVNREYNTTQGAEFAMLRAVLTGVINAVGFDEFQYAFRSGLVSDEILGALSGAGVPPKALLKSLYAFVLGIGGKEISKETVKAALGAVKNAAEIMIHYKNYPETPEGFEEWCAKADRLYERIGKIK